MFIVWDALHDIGLAVHKSCQNDGLDKIPDNEYTKDISWFIAFSYASLAWILSRVADMTVAIILIDNILRTTSLSDTYISLMEYPLWLATVLISLKLHSTRETGYN